MRPAFLIMRSNDTFLNDHGTFGPLKDAALFRPAVITSILKVVGNCVAIQLTAVAKLKRRSQAGFGVLLIEMLIASTVLLTLAAMAIPSFIRMRQGQQQQTAHNKVLMVGFAKGQLAICSSEPSCVPPAALSAIVPAPGTVYQSEGYVYSESADGETFQAIPIDATANQVSYSIGPTTVITCNGGVCR